MSPEQRGETSEKGAQHARYLRYLESRACEAEVLAAAQEGLFRLLRELERASSVSALRDLLELRLRALLPLASVLVVLRESPCSETWWWGGEGRKRRESMSLSPEERAALEGLPHPAGLPASQMPSLAPEGAETLLVVPVVQGETLWGGIVGAALPQGGFSGTEERLAGILALHLGLRLEALSNSRRLAEEGLRLRRELAVAAAVQRGMRPPAVVHWPEGRAVTWCHPLGDVSGDACDLLRDPEGKVHLLLADAMGHGVAAGLVVSFLRGLFLSHLLREGGDPQKLAALVDEGLKSVGNDDDAPFCTVIHGTWDARRRRLSYLSAAGAPSFLLRCSGEMVTLDATMALLGVLPVVPEAREVEGFPGDLVCCCSDGLLEALPSCSARSPRECLATWLREMLGKNDLEEIPALVQEEVERGRWVLRDDATLVLLELGTRENL